jgi:hypothetical protein
MRAVAVLLALLLAFAACTRDASPPAETPSPAPAAVFAPTTPPSQPGEDGARAFVAAFMDNRMVGDEPRARQYLSPDALEQFLLAGESGSGIPLTSMSYTGWELVSLEAADANSYEVRVRIRREDEPTDETLFVGPGADAGGQQRTWIVRGVARP